MPDDTHIPVRITGAAVHVPGLEDAGDILRGVAPPADAIFAPKEILGKKGLFGKDRATLLALCAAHKALQDAGVDHPLPDAPARRFGVVVSSNFGNFDTVEKVLTTVRSGSSRDASMMDAPNASGNIIASSAAIRFNMHGPNYTVCNAAAGGLDALRLAAEAIHADRADAMIVIGVEPRNAVVQRYVEARSGDGKGVRLADAAAALVVEGGAPARRRGARAYYQVSGYSRTYGSARTKAVLEWAARIPETAACIRFAPPHVFSGEQERVGDGGMMDVIDIERGMGLCHGLLGVAQAVAACELNRRAPGAPAYAILEAGGRPEAAVSAVFLTPAIS